MAEKKNEVITLRTETWVKEGLQRVAEINKWSIAQTANQIIMNYLLNPKENEITIQSKDFINAAIKIRKENSPKAVEIKIKWNKDPETEETKKCLSYRLLEAGGLGCIDDFDEIYEMTEDQISKIP